MYEPLTHRARNVMLLAQKEAKRFNLNYIGTEHILLALVVEGRGVAANVLRSLNVDLRGLRRELEDLILTEPRVSVVGTLPQTPQAKNAIAFAIEEARHLNQHYVGTEHLLLGLLREDMGAAAQVLMNHRLSVRQVRDEVVKLLKSGARLTPEFLSTAAQMTLGWPAPKEIEDLSPDLRQSTAELDGELRRAIHAKETAVAEADFETAAALRDVAIKLKRKKDALIREWMVNHPIDAAWLSWSGGAAFKLVQRIHEHCRWDALPELADVLEQAGCTDAEILNHCREGSEHSSQCWVIDVLLAHV